MPGERAVQASGTGTRKAVRSGRLHKPEAALRPDTSPTPSQVPSATYRLQFSKSFRFEHAIQILDYLHDLGITHVYASPILGSRSGSEHGYDATDPTRIDPDLGSEEDFFAFQDALRERGMGLVLDIVPNHMAASSENPWWMDVLENGPGSPFASYFDIDWHPGPRSLDGKILLPILGQPFGEVLESGDLRLSMDGGRFLIHYYESIFPLSPKSYRQVLIHRIDSFKDQIDEKSPSYEEYAGILASLASLFRNEGGLPESASEKRLKFEATRSRLKQLLATSAEIEGFVQANVKEFNGRPGDPASFSLLEGLLSEQHYKLAHWQNVNESINYRRFFTITDLVGIRVEDPAVFEATHALILRIASRQPSVGLRIDHVDGLRDPEGYLQTLRERLRAGRHEDQPQDAYVVVEKILEHDEQLPDTWPIEGTTGYDYLNHANAIFTYPDHAGQMERIYSRFIGKELNFEEVVAEKKRLVMNGILGVEVRALGRQLAELAADDRYARELLRPELMSALIEVTAWLPIYRTYARNLTIPEDAKPILEEAIAKARVAKPHLNPACFDFLRDVLLLLASPHVLSRQREARLGFVMRWQQFTGPIMAKGVEDTALYVYYPLLSLNEVGGDARPSAADSKEQFLSFLGQRHKRWLHSMNATTTHDTKRSEDVRARIDVLSEIPSEWDARLKRWSELNAGHKTEINGEKVPDANEEYLLYQTLLGACPADGEMPDSLRERVREYVIKATREAMVHTRWTRPNLPHETALTDFVDAVLDDRRSAEFLKDFRDFHAPVSFFGMINSLSQTLLKITSPGVPDFYQGSEMWDLRLVDPDNRRPVDFGLYLDFLQSLDDDRRDPIVQGHDLLARWPDGRVKLWLVDRALRFRHRHFPLFTHGGFRALRVSGERAECVIAFLRGHERDAAIVVVPRWLAHAQLPPGRFPSKEFWKHTSLQLPSGEHADWRNVLTNESLSVRHGEAGTHLEVGDILSSFPVALLSGQRSPEDAVERQVSEETSRE